MLSKAFCEKIKANNLLANMSGEDGELIPNNVDIAWLLSDRAEIEARLR